MMQHRLGIRSGLEIYPFTPSYSLSLISYLVLWNKSPQNLVTWSHYTHWLSLTISVGQEFRAVVLTSVSHELVVKWWLNLGSSWRLLQSRGWCWLERLDQRELGLFFSSLCGSPCRLSSLDFLHVGSRLPRCMSQEKVLDKGYFISYYLSLEVRQYHV